MYNNLVQHVSQGLVSKNEEKQKIIKLNGILGALL